MRTAPTRTLRRFPAVLLAMLAACWVAPAFASDPPAAPLPAWEQLSDAQRQQLIGPVRERWNAEPAQRARMLQHAQRWRQMTPEQRRNARRGLHRWEHMDAGQREQMRALFETSRGLPPGQRAALRERWKQMTPEQRGAWLRERAAQR